MTRTVGYLVVTVPRSPSAPHAVLVNDALRYPRRNGTTTYYMSEPDVAQACQGSPPPGRALTRR